MPAADNKRIASIDILRGLAIFGMILCANIGWNSDLPAWMFHAQVPPPEYTFKPDLPGITWVDLVFPFFIFSMGAAFPFALNKRIEEGRSRISIAAGLVKRWLILFLFSLFLGNAYKIGSSELPSVWKNLMMIAGWGTMFLALCRFNTGNRHFDKWANPAGYLLAAAFITCEALVFDVPVSKSYSNIIIMVLSYVSLAGGLIWMLTRNSITARWIVFSVIAIIKGIASYKPEILEFATLPDSIGWCFSYKFLQYLMVAIPGSVVGDIIMKADKPGHTAVSAGRQRESRNSAAALAAVFAVVIQLWGLFVREVYTDLAVTAILGIIFFVLTFRDKSLWNVIGRTGFILLVAGIIFDPVDDGIKKDPCNLSYLLATSGMAALTVSALIYAERSYGFKGRLLARCGQNPMMAYTVTGFFTIPVLSLAGILQAFDPLTVGSPVLGLARGLVITAIMVAVTAFFSSRKIFWRS